MTFIAVLGFACAGPHPPEVVDLDARAAELAHRFLIVDTHIDLPFRLTERPEDVSRATATGDFDYPRAIRGGLDVAFMSIYVPASYQDEGGARKFADQLIDGVESLAREHPGKFVLVSSPDGARNVERGTVIGLALGIENGAAIENDLNLLRHFHERGVRYITLAHSKNNLICDSSYDEERRWDGLSPFGVEVVQEMNRLGLMIDVSHLSDRAFQDVIEHSRAPVIASHSSCRHFTPDWERNMSDGMIRTLAGPGGVIQINFGSSFLDDEYRRRSEESRKAILRLMEQAGVGRDSEEGRKIRDEHRVANPNPVTDVTRVVDHIDHVVGLVGIDHVGLGSDFDGVGESLPVGLKSVADYPNLIRELLVRGYSESQIEKICGGNLLRVWSEIERAARVGR